MYLRNTVKTPLNSRITPVKKATSRKDLIILEAEKITNTRLFKTLSENTKADLLEFGENRFIVPNLINYDNIYVLAPIPHNERTAFFGALSRRDMIKIKFISPTQDIKLLDMRLFLETKRNTIPTLKTLLEDVTLLDTYSRERENALTIESKLTMFKSDKTPIYKNLLEKKYSKMDYSVETDYMLQDHIVTKSDDGYKLGYNMIDRTDPIIIDRFLGEVTPTIVSDINKSGKCILYSPTGTGKSHFALKDLPRYYNNIMIISPFRLVTNEHQTEIFKSMSVKDMEHPYLSLTTDVFHNFRKGILKEEFAERLKQVELFILDEQHIYDTSIDFRHKVVETIEELMSVKTKTLFLSGTPLPMDGFKVIDIVQKTKPTINYYDNTFGDVESIMNDIRSKEDSVLFYCETVVKSNEVANLLLENNLGKDIILINSKQFEMNGNPISGDVTEWAKDNTVYVGTTRVTTGVNLKNLGTIYQYGTAYSPSTLIQLMARLRKDGDYHYIAPRFKTMDNHNRVSQAISLAQNFLELKVNRLSNAWHSPQFKRFIEDRLLLLRSETTVQGFISTYRAGLSLLAGKKLGHIEEVNGEEDFYFYPTTQLELDLSFEDTIQNVHKKEALREISLFLNSRENIKEIERFNLGFDLVVSDKPLAVGKHLITDTDGHINKLSEKLKGVVSQNNLLKSFNLEEIEKLSNTNIHIESIRKIRKVADRLVALKCYMITKKELLTLSADAVAETGFISVKQLDLILQKKYPTTSRLATPYARFIRTIFKSNEFNVVDFKYVYKKTINKVKHFDTIVLTNDSMRTKTEYLKAIDNAMFNQPIAS